MCNKSIDMAPRVWAPKGTAPALGSLSQLSDVDKGALRLPLLSLGDGVRRG